MKESFEKADLKPITYYLKAIYPCRYCEYLSKQPARSDCLRVNCQSKLIGKRPGLWSPDFRLMVCD